MLVSLALIILGDELCQLFKGFIVLLSRIAISNLFRLIFHHMRNIFYGLHLFILKGNICLLPLFSMSLGCVNYVLASCTLAYHDYEVLHAPGCGSLVIFHVGRRSQP